MPQLKQDMTWFKDQFKTKIQAGVQNTPFSVDMVTAIATQETRYIWGRLYSTLSLAEVLKLCASDIIDAPSRDAFPKNKAELLTAPRGAEMFTIGREALKALAVYLQEFRKYAKDDTFPNKFCRGYGIFQYDLQFYKNNPDFFLEKRWYDFDECLKLFVQELKDALKRAYGSGKSTLTDEEMVYVAIAYNRGSVNFSRKFKQGHKDDSGKYYGEYIWEYLQLSKTIT